MRETRFDKRMKKIRQDADRILVDRDTKVVVISDCHRGNGGCNDNFAKNEKLYLAALNEYYKQNYTYIELGDADELWENKDYHRIIHWYSHIFELLAKFYKEERMYMVYGNHDRKKKSSWFNEKYLGEYFSETQNQNVPLFPAVNIKEGLLLVIPSKTKSFAKEVKTILLVHGNQGESWKDTLWKKSKGVRLLVEKWAVKEKQMLIAGYSHCPVCKEDKDACYFNCGSCVQPDSITAIEVERNELRLVKWFADTDDSKHPIVKKECLSKHII